MSRFQVGDKVRAFGVEGFVYSVEGSGVIVDFPNDADGVHFYSDGRIETWHKEPTLVLVERAKPEWLRTYYRDSALDDSPAVNHSQFPGAVLLIDSRPVGELAEKIKVLLRYFRGFKDPLFLVPKVTAKLEVVEALLGEDPIGP